MIRTFLALIVAIIFLYCVMYFIAPVTSERTIATSTPEAVVVATNLHVPWDIAFLPDASLLVTERAGTLVHIDPAADSYISIPVAVTASGEGGLLGIALHPDFIRNSYVYLYMSSSSGATSTINRVMRYTFSADTLTPDREIIGNIPGAANHDGGRIEFGPDRMLYITTGDALNRALAQSTSSLAGKILRVSDDGSIPSGNSFGNAVWSYGHRNPQGLAWDADGNLWETEHGPSGESAQCCHDEINQIRTGLNYGWPEIVGDESAPGLTQSAWHSADDTWAPASLLYFNNSLYFGGLRGEALYEARLQNGAVVGLTKHLSGVYGRIRTIRLGPDSMFYITTSNTDGRGSAQTGDDRIIKIDPASVR